jgi:uncharacterized protein with PIN domain
VADPDTRPHDRLLVDGMLGTLAKSLRLLGYDTAFDSSATDDELAHRARAEDRVLVTSDRELSSRRGLRTVHVSSQSLGEQVHEVQSHIGSANEAPLSRCLACNGSLQAVDRDQVAQLVPPFIARTKTEFHRCPSCGRVYWSGSHIDGMRAKLAALDGDPETSP